MVKCSFEWFYNLLVSEWSSSVIGERETSFIFEIANQDRRLCRWKSAYPTLQYEARADTSLSMVCPILSCSTSPCLPVSTPVNQVDERYDDLIPGKPTNYLDWFSKSCFPSNFNFNWCTTFQLVLLIWGNAILLSEYGESSLHCVGICKGSWIIFPDCFALGANSHFPKIVHLIGKWEILCHWLPFH